jgi:hypothetical protein
MINVLVGESEERRPLGRSWHRCEIILKLIIMKLEVRTGPWICPMGILMKTIKRPPVKENWKNNLTS